MLLLNGRSERPLPSCGEQYVTCLASDLPSRGDENLARRVLQGAAIKKTIPYQQSNEDKRSIHSFEILDLKV